MRVTEKTSGRGVVWLGTWLISFFHLFADPVSAQPTAGDLLVKVHLDREFQGILHENRLIPGTRVHEVAEFDGAVVDSRGYVVSYVGSFWPYLSVPRVRVTIETAAGQQHPARLVGVDERIALAVLESEGLKGRSLAFGSSFTADRLHFTSPKNGGWRVFSVAPVKVQESDWLPEKRVYVAAVAPALTELVWEGSLVLDEKGKLLGITTHIGSHSFSKKMSIFQVLPFPVIQSSLGRIVKEKRSIGQGWLGIALEPRSRRPKVKDVVVGSPAQKAGMQAGDLVLRVDDHPVKTGHELARAICWKGVGNELTLTVDRDGRQRQVSALLTKRQDKRPPVVWALQVPRAWKEDWVAHEDLRLYRTVLPLPFDLGFVLDPLNPQLAEYFGCPEGSGLLIKSVLEGSPAAKVGFKAGDVLTGMNGRDLSSSADFQKRVEMTKDSTITIQFVRDHRLQTRKLLVK